MVEKELNDETLGKILASLGDSPNLAAELSQLHAKDLAELMERLDGEQRLAIFGALRAEQLSDVLLFVSDETRDELIGAMSPAQISSAIVAMDSDDAADFVSELPKQQAEKVLAKLPAEDLAEVRSLLRYPEDSAGGLMQLELVSLNEWQTCSDAINVIRSMAEEVEELHNVFVTDSGGVLTGIVPLRKLILSPPDTPISRIMEKDPVAVKVMENEEEVANIFRKYDIVSLAVIDDRGRLMGRILHDDILDVITEIDTEDILKAAGTNDEELESRSWLSSARYRLPWLLSSLAGGILMAGIISGNDAPMRHMVALAAFIPVIMGMSGNVSTQSSAIVVRGLALGRINGMDMGRFILKEMKVGVAMAFFCGGLIGFAASLLNENPVMGMVVGISLLGSMAFASMVGTSIPLLLDRMKLDPVLGAGPIVLTIMDISSLTIYFTVASALIRVLA